MFPSHDRFTAVVSYHKML